MPKLLSSLFNKSGLILEDLFAFISAPKCPGCDEYLESPRLHLCPACENGLNYPGDGPVCLICRSPEGISCNCHKVYQNAIPYLYYWAPYSEIIRQLIHQFKFEGQVKLGNYLISIALERLRERLTNIDAEMIVPVPMLKSDTRRRTFNQSELIAEALSEQLGIPVRFDLVKKIKATKLQANLGRDERWLNIKGVFEVDISATLETKSVLLVDDIVTTGATSLEAAGALYDAGIEKVTVFSLASSHGEANQDF